MHVYRHDYSTYVLACICVIMLAFVCEGVCDRSCVYGGVCGC